MPRNAVEEMLMTRVDQISYDVKRRIGSIHMARDCCCDMVGAIKLFERIDPKVKRIDAHADNRSDTFYIRKNKTWQAFPCTKSRQKPS